MDQEFDNAFSWLSLTGSNAVIDMFDGNAPEGFPSPQHDAHTILHNVAVQRLDDAFLVGLQV